MNQDVENEVQNDQEIEKIGQELGKTAADKAGNTIKKAVNNVKKIISDAWKKIPMHIRLWIIVGAVGLMLVFMVLAYFQKLFGDNNVAGVAVESIIEENVKIAKAENDEDGYYFKIDKDILNKFKIAINQAYANGEYEVDLDNLLDSDGDDVDSDEETSSTNGTYDEDDPQFDEEAIADLFHTDSQEQAEAYLVKMIKAQIASSYPKIGIYGEENKASQTATTNGDISDRLGNEKDKDGDYIAQGTIQIKRTLLTGSSNTTSQAVPETTSQGKSNLVNDSYEDFNGMKYYQVLPKEMESNLPLIIHLHGDGAGIKSLETLPISQYITSGQGYESGKFVYIAPYAVVGDVNGDGDPVNWWDIRDGHEPKVMKLIEQVVQQYGIDTSRIIITGHSRGAVGVWYFANRYPNYFAAAVPVSCSGSIRAENFATTPVWAICGTTGRDAKYYLEPMEKYVNKIKEVPGAIAELEKIDGGHTDTPKYLARKEIFDWMLAQNKKNPTNVRPTITSSGTEAFSAGGEITLSYLPYDNVNGENGEDNSNRTTYKGLVEANDINALKYFSFDPEKGLIYYATYTQDVAMDNGEMKSTKYTIKENSISYKSVTSMCCMPFNYLFSLLQTSENPEWVMKVADLVLDTNQNEVVLMIQDQMSVTTYTELERQVLKETAGIVVNPSKTIGQTSKYEFPYRYGTDTETTSVTYENSANVYLKTAKTWLIDFEQEAELNVHSDHTANTYEDKYTNDDYDEAVGDTPFRSYATLIITSEEGESRSRYVDNWDLIKSHWGDTDWIKNYFDIAEDESYSFRVTNRYLGTLLYSDETTITDYKWEVTTKTEKQINYNKFLGTWKNETGTYKKGELYKADGKEIAYSLPSDYIQKSYPAQTITSSDQGDDIDILLELLLRHEDTQIHEQLMRYFWNIYMGYDVYDINIDELLGIFDTAVYKRKRSGSLSVNGTTISREDFIECVQNYQLGSNQPRHANRQEIYNTRFAAYADVIYDVCTKNNVNPVLCVAMAGLESAYGTSDYAQSNKFNCWGIGGTKPWSFNSMEEAVEKWCSIILTYQDESTWQCKACHERGAECATYSDLFSETEVSLYEIITVYCPLETHKEGTSEAIKKQLGIECHHAVGTPTTAEEKAEHAIWYVEVVKTRAQWVFGDKAFGSTIVEACQELSEILRTKGKAFRYPQRRDGSWDMSLIIRYNIEKYYYGDDTKGGNTGICCADYVAMVLYYSKTFKAETINMYNYNGTGGIKNLLKDAGWQQISYAEAEPGDVGIWDGTKTETGHAFFYWTNDTVWDESVYQYYYWGEYKNCNGPHGYSHMKQATYYRAP